MRKQDLALLSEGGSQLGHQVALGSDVHSVPAKIVLRGGTEVSTLTNWKANL